MERKLVNELLMAIVMLGAGFTAPNPRFDEASTQDGSEALTGVAPGETASADSNSPVTTVGSK